MPKGVSFSGSVEDVLIRMGLDATGLREGLRAAQVEVKVAADQLRTPLAALQSVFAQLNTQAGPTTAVRTFELMQAKVEGFRASLIAANKEMWALMGVNRQAMAAAPATLATAALGGLGAPTQRGWGGGLGGGWGQGPGGGGGGRGQGPGGGGGGGGQWGAFSSGWMLTHMLLGGVLYGGLDFAERAFKRPIDLMRLSEETGMSGKDTQILEMSAAKTDTPIELLATTVSRVQERIESGTPKTIKALKSMGLDAKEMGKLFETDAAKGIVTLATALEGLGSKSEKVRTFLELVGGRSGRAMLAWQEFAKGAENAVMMTDAQMESVARLSKKWEVAKLSALAYFDTILSRIAEGTSNPASGGQMVGPLAGMVVGGSLGFMLGGPWGALAGGVAGLFGGDAVMRGADLARQKLFGKDPEVPEVLKESGGSSAFDQDKADELKKQNLKEIIDLLGQFGVKGTRESQVVESAWEDLNAAFNEGRITIQELYAATASYFDMLENRTTEAEMRNAVAQFRHGIIGQDELDRLRYLHQVGRGEDATTSAYLQGKISAEGLRKGFDTSQGLRENAPEVQTPAQRSLYQRLWNQQEGLLQNFNLPGPRRIPKIQIPQDSPQSRNLTPGSINVVPVDDLSQLLLSRWQQQGATG